MQFLSKLTTESESAPPSICELLRWTFNAKKASILRQSSKWNGRYLVLQNRQRVLSIQAKGKPNPLWIRIFTHFIALSTSDCCKHLIWSKKSCENKSICKYKLDFILGLTQWNQNRFEFKYDDTRLSSYYKNKAAQLIFLMGPILFLHY